MPVMFSCARLAACGLLVALAGPAVADVLFLEDFQTRLDPDTGEPMLRCSGDGGAGTYPFPSGWLLRNVDNRTPEASVAYVNEAWEVREDFSFNVANCAAFSTSWYSPVGAADDWMWTPLIPLPAAGTLRLTWRAVAYDPAFADGYEVRVMTASAGSPTGGTGVLGNQVTGSTTLFSVAAESTSWIARSVDLGAYAGQSVYIGFRNNSNDKFLLLIDDIVVESLVEYDPELLSITDTLTGEYAKVPGPLAFGFDIEAQVRNSGSEPLTGVVVDADLLVDGGPIASVTSTPIAALAPGATQSLTVGGSAYVQEGAWSIEAVVGANEGDEVVGNSALALPLTVVTADELTRAEGEATGVIGIGAGTEGEIGTHFDVPVAALLEAVRVVIVNVDDEPDGTGEFNGYDLEVRIREWNTDADEPGDLIAFATTQVPVDAPVAPLPLEFDFGGMLLAPGRYLVALVEPTTPAPRALTLHTMPQRYTAGAGWAIWPGSPLGGWGNIEEFSAQFERALAITAVLGVPLTVPVAQDDAFVVAPFGTLSADVASNDQPSDEGGNNWTVTSAPASGVLLMQPDGAFTYTPDPSAEGSTLGFEYAVCDVDNDCDTAQVQVQVLPVRIFGDAFE